MATSRRDAFRAVLRTYAFDSAFEGVGTSWDAFIDLVNEHLNEPLGMSQKEHTNPRCNELTWHEFLLQGFGLDGSSGAGHLRLRRQESAQEQPSGSS